MHPIIALIILAVSLIGASICEELYCHYAKLAEEDEEQIRREKIQKKNVKPARKESRTFVMINLKKVG